MKHKVETEELVDELSKTRIVVFLLFLISVSCYSQISIKGVIIDSLTTQPIFNATVQILDVNTNSTIAYSISNNKGEFSNTVNEVTEFKLKINHLGYNSYLKTFKSPFSDFLKIQLSENENVLGAVVLEIKNEFNVKKDTISFNLEKMRDSTEVVLKDLVDKLPGITIDENKKIQFQGQQIDKVLINGNDFFGKKHEMATENIPADAVAGIDLLTNYKDFDQISSTKKNGKIVLNISLHKDYKGKIIGNIEANYGAENRYLFHTNLFNFTAKGNVAFVSDINNTGESAVNVLDYIELKGGIEAFIDDFSGASGTYTIDDSKFPRYVISNDEVDTRTVNFNSVNFTRSFSEKTKFNGYIIFDKTDQTELQFLEKEIFSTSSTNQLFENQENTNENTLVNSYFNIAFKPNQDQSFRYQLKANTFSTDNELAIQNTINGSNFDAFNDVKDIGIGQNFNYKQNISSKLQLVTGISYDYKSNEDEERITSNNPFLGLTFENDNYTLLNTSETKEEIFNLRSMLSYDASSKTNFDYNFQFNTTKVSIDNATNNSDVFNTDITRKIQLFSNEFSMNHRFSQRFQVRSKLNAISASTEVNSNNERYFWLNPSLNFRFRVNSQKEISLEYSRKTSFIGNQYIFENQFIKDYQTIVNQASNDFFEPITNDSFSFTYSNFRQRKNSLFSLKASHAFNQNDISFNTLFSPNNVVTKNLYRADNKLWELNMNYSRSLFKLPLRNKYAIIYSRRTTENQFDGSPNTVINNSLRFSIDSNSKFKKSSVQLQFSFAYSQMDIKNTFDNLDFFTKTFESSFGLNGKLFKKIFWDTSYGYTKVNTAQLSNEINMLNFNLRYTTKNKRIQFHVRGNNILNIDSNDNISQIFTDSYNQTSSYRLLRGYITLGMKYDF